MGLSKIILYYSSKMFVIGLPKATLGAGDK